MRYELSSVPGVSEVASIGGFVRQYQVTVDPNRLIAYGISLGLEIECGCFGTADGSRAGLTKIVENLGMLAVAVVGCLRSR